MREDHYIEGVKRLVSALVGITFLFTSMSTSHSHSDGVFTIHEVSERVAPKAILELQKDPTGGFNVHVVTSNFVWRPEQASKKHVVGEGHAHVYLDGRKIMRIYNEWFHLNTFQFSTRAGEQLLSIEFVGNDHAPYTLQGNPIGSEQIINVPRDEIQPVSTNRVGAATVIPVLLVVLFTGSLLWRRFRSKN
jgi:hypothetical protein